MSHFLRATEIRGHLLQKPYAAVLVRVSGRRELTVDAGNLFILDPSKCIELTELPADVRVLSSEGVVVEASRRFWITVGTFDPCHALVDMNVPW